MGRSPDAPSGIRKANDLLVHVGVNQGSVSLNPTFIFNLLNPFALNLCRCRISVAKSDLIVSSTLTPNQPWVAQMIERSKMVKGKRELPQAQRCLTSTRRNNTLASGRSDASTSVETFLAVN